MIPCPTIYSGPDWGFPRGDARLDLTDLYAFSKPGDAGKSILITNVHPSVGENPPGPTTPDPFAPEALYELKVDTDGDAVADIAYRVRVSSSEGGARTATLRRVEGAEAAGTGDGGQAIVEAAPVSTGRGGTLVAANGARGGWVQVERGARPLQLFLVLGLPGAERGAYLGGEPADDVRFIMAFAHALEHTGGYTPEEARRTAGTMLPEILPYDPTRPASFPDNGRTLTDDVVDAFLAVLTNGKVTADKVGPHGDLLAEFPYLGPPHNA